MNASMYPPDAASLAHICSRDFPSKGKKKKKKLIENPNDCLNYFWKYRRKSCFLVSVSVSRGPHEEARSCLALSEVNEQFVSAIW